MKGDCLDDTCYACFLVRRSDRRVGRYVLRVVTYVLLI